MIRPRRTGYLQCAAGPKITKFLKNNFSFSNSSLGIGSKDSHHFSVCRISQNDTTLYQFILCMNFTFYTLKETNFYHTACPSELHLCLDLNFGGKWQPFFPKFFSVTVRVCPVLC